MEKDDSFKMNEFVTFTMEDREPLELTGEIRETLKIEDESVTVTKCAVDVKQSKLIKQIRSGKVLGWNDTKKFGFISEDGTNERIFIHISDLPEGLSNLSKFQRVQFKKYKNKKGFQAKGLEVLQQSQTGVCCNWNEDKKCGTIESNGERYYIHNSNLIGIKGYRKLEKGQKVSFQIYTNGMDRTEAIDVKLI